VYWPPLMVPNKTQATLVSCDLGMQVMNPTRSPRRALYMLCCLQIVSKSLSCVE
jgi:hypothetical protein